MNKLTLKEVGILIGAVDTYQRGLAAKKARAYTPAAVERLSISIEEAQALAGKLQAEHSRLVDEERQVAKAIDGMSTAERMKQSK